MTTHELEHQRFLQSIADYRFVVPLLEGLETLRGMRLHQPVNEKLDLGEGTDLLAIDGTRVSVRGFDHDDIGWWTKSVGIRLCRQCFEEAPFLSFEGHVKRNDRCRSMVARHCSNEWTKLRLHVRWHFHYYRTEDGSGVAAGTLVDVPAFFRFYDSSESVEDWAYDRQVRLCKDTHRTPFVNVRPLEPDGFELKPYVCTFRRF